MAKVESAIACPRCEWQLMNITTFADSFEKWRCPLCGWTGLGELRLPYEISSTGTGYFCPDCGTFVPAGVTHGCSTGTIRQPHFLPADFPNMGGPSSGDLASFRGEVMDRLERMERKLNAILEKVCEL